MEAINFSEMSEGYYRSTWLYNPEHHAAQTTAVSSDPTQDVLFVQVGLSQKQSFIKYVYI
jgi:hypothetical protein